LTLRITILCQDFPIPGADFVFLQMADVADELSRRGHDVSVLATNHGSPLQTPAAVGPASSVRVRRLPFTWFGNRSYALRIAAAVSFFLQTGFVLLVGRRPDVLVVSTAPPMIGPVAAGLAALRRVPIVFWAMDLHPDQLAAIGGISPNSLLYRMLDGMMRWFVRRCSTIVALDEPMRQQLINKGAVPGRIAVVPPWADDRSVRSLPVESPATDTDARATADKTLLYSGNLSTSNPIAALITAFEQTAADHDMRLVFIGTGGLAGEARAASARLPKRIALSPPVAGKRLPFELAQGDIHVATMGSALTGILHPSKVYTAIAAGRPVLFVGPVDSPSARLVAGHGLGWAVPHDPAQIAAVLMQISRLSRESLQAIGRHCLRVSQENFSQVSLCRQVVECIERVGSQAGRR
jgi:colanic acid biosynthesis glycosyl transferase WcaI